MIDKFQYHANLKESKFDRLEFTVRFMPGNNNIGAIAYEFINAIEKHDEIALKIENQLTKVDALKRDFRRKDKKLKQLERKYNELNKNPEDYEEYKELIKRNANDPERIKKIREPAERILAETRYARYLELHPICSQLLELEPKIETARKLVKKAKDELSKGEQELLDLWEEEEILANKISEDHVAADQQKITLKEYFSNVHLGYILAKYDGEDVSKIPFEKVLEKIKLSNTTSDLFTDALLQAEENKDIGKSVNLIEEEKEKNKKVNKWAKKEEKSEDEMPNIDLKKKLHICIFEKYDYQFDWPHKQWLSLETLKKANVVLEDYKAEVMKYVTSASEGKIEDINAWLSAGYDVDAADYTDCTALHMASAKGHLEIVKLLCHVGADANYRDKNMLTPVLSAVRAGRIDILDVLLQNKGDVNAIDSQTRGIEYYALLSASLPMIQLFINRGNIDNVVVPYSQSKSVHMVAEMINDEVEIMTYLLSLGASIYHLNKDGELPYTIARKVSNRKVYALIENVRLHAPVHCVYITKDRGLEIWVGNARALNSRFVQKIGFHRMICVVPSEEVADSLNLTFTKNDVHICVLDYVDPNMVLENQHSVVKKSFDQLLDDVLEDEEDDEDDTWLRLTYYLPSMAAFIKKCLKTYEKRNFNFTNPMRVLICDYDIYYNTNNSIDDESLDSATITTSHSNNDINSTTSRPNSASSQNDREAISNDTVSGNHISPAALAAIMLLTQHIRVKETLKNIIKFRPTVQLRPALVKGVTELQDDYDHRKTKRLDNKLRHSDILAYSF